MQDIHFSGLQVFMKRKALSWTSSLAHCHQSCLFAFAGASKKISIMVGKYHSFFTPKSHSLPCHCHNSKFLQESFHWAKTWTPPWHLCFQQPINSLPVHASAANTSFLHFSIQSTPNLSALHSNILVCSALWICITVANLFHCAKFSDSSIQNCVQWLSFFFLMYLWTPSILYSVQSHLVAPTLDLYSLSPPARFYLLPGAPQSVWDLISWTSILAPSIFTFSYYSIFCWCVPSHGYELCDLQSSSPSLFILYSPYSAQFFHPWWEHQASRGSWKLFIMTL